MALLYLLGHSPSRSVSEIGMCLFYRFFCRMEFVFLINPCELVFFIHTRSLLFIKHYLSFGSLHFENEAAMPKRTQPH